MSFFKTIFSRQFLLTLVLIFLLVLFAVPLTKNWRQKRSIDKEVKDMQQQVADLEHKNSSLKQVLDYMQSDQFVEKEARTKLNYKKTGEEVAIIESRDGTSPTVSPSDSVFDLPEEPKAPGSPKLLGNFSKWLDYFFKK
ncbi:MAG: septum formation initiator family protein [Candidatus Falkowbacteria bacterium]|nr:septum formation initiator family protein [Candidatus Falkowbacteria bacterium]